MRCYYSKWCFASPLQCRQLVAVCDEILSSSPESLLTHTAQLESVDLVPVAPGDQLVKPYFEIEVPFFFSSEEKYFDCVAYTVYLPDMQNLHEKCPSALFIHLILTLFQ